jgi:hypothetical protein
VKPGAEETEMLAGSAVQAGSKPAKEHGQGLIERVSKKPTELSRVGDEDVNPKEIKVF